MTEHNLMSYPNASFTNAQLPPLKVAALYFDKLVILDPVGANWATGRVEDYLRVSLQTRSNYYRNQW